MVVHLVELLDAVAGAEGVGEIPEALGVRHPQFLLQGLAVNCREGSKPLLPSPVQLALKAVMTDLQRAQGFLQAFLEGPADRHDLTDGLHLNS